MCSLIYLRSIFYFNVKTYDKFQISRLKWYFTVLIVMNHSRLLMVFQRTGLKYMTYFEFNYFFIRFCHQVTKNMSHTFLMWNKRRFRITIAIFHQSMFRISAYKIEILHSRIEINLAKCFVHYNIYSISWFSCFNIN